MGFKLYKLYFLLPYTNPTPKPTPHRKLSVWFISLFPHGECTGLTILEEKFGPHNVISTRYTHTLTLTYTYMYNPPLWIQIFPSSFQNILYKNGLDTPKKHGLHWIQRATANSDLWLICVSLACIILIATKQEWVKTERKMNSWCRPAVFLCLWTRTSLSILFSWEKCERLQPCPVSVYWTGHISAQHIHHYFPLWYCVCLRHLPGLKIGQKRQVSTIMSLAGQKTQATQI